MLDEAEQFYVEQARKKASFSTGCDDDVQVMPLQSSTVPVQIALSWGSVYVGEITTALGVDACGTKLVYNVVCGRHRHYEAMTEMGRRTWRNPAPCELALDGGPTEAAVRRTDEEDAEAEEARRRRAAAMAQ